MDWFQLPKQRSSQWRLSWNWDISKASFSYYPWCFFHLETYFIAGLNICLLPLIQHGWKISHQPKKLLGNTWYYDCFPVEWGKEKRWGKERWVNPHTYSKSLSSRITALPGNFSPQESTQDPSLAQLLPLLIARRQLAEAALNRAAAPCSHLSGQHHPWLMQPSWKSFIVQQLLTALSWEMQPSASLWSALWHLGAEVGLAAVPPVHREAGSEIFYGLWSPGKGWWWWKEHKGWAAWHPGTCSCCHQQHLLLHPH